MLLIDRTPDVVDEACSGSFAEDVGKVVELLETLRRRHRSIHKNYQAIRALGLRTPACTNNRPPHFSSQPFQLFLQVGLTAKNHHRALHVARHAGNDASSILQTVTQQQQPRRTILEDFAQLLVGEAGLLVQAVHRDKLAIIVGMNRFDVLHQCTLASRRGRNRLLRSSSLLLDCRSDNRFYGRLNNRSSFCHRRLDSRGGRLNDRSGLDYRGLDSRRGGLNGRSGLGYRGFNRRRGGFNDRGDLSYRGFNSRRGRLNDRSGLGYRGFNRRRGGFNDRGGLSYRGFNSRKGRLNDRSGLGYRGFNSRSRFSSAGRLGGRGGGVAKVEGRNFLLGSFGSARSKLDGLPCLGVPVGATLERPQDHRFAEQAFGIRLHTQDFGILARVHRRLGKLGKPLRGGDHLPGNRRERNALQAAIAVAEELGFLATQLNQALTDFRGSTQSDDIATALGVLPHLQSHLVVIFKRKPFFPRHTLPLQSNLFSSPQMWCSR
ncbi:hypothetical protein [Geopseudomonas aromaticivorans]